ncbi:MAG: hypothetical protein HY872_00315 [Chloroflexi bacterium]|nr:hypothetical protein [Chloroflexota bacterium]
MATLDISFFQLAGGILFFGCMLFIYAFSAPNSKAFSASDPLEKLQAVASNVKGWRLHSIFSVPTFFLWTIGLGVLAGGLSETAPRGLAFLATGLSFAAGVSWSFLAAKRLRVGREIENLIRNYPAEPARTHQWAFPTYTVTTLLSLAAGGLAVALSGFWVGWVAAGLALIALLVVYPLRRDLPPFVSGFLALILAIGLLFIG